MTAHYPQADNVDILLLLEGTYPFVKGGVASWTDHIIRSFPQFRFGVVFLGGQRQDYGEPVFKFPDNLVHFEKHYLFEDIDAPKQKNHAVSEQALTLITKLHDWFRSEKKDAHSFKQQIFEFFTDPKKHISLEQFFHSEAVWEYISESYQKFCTDHSFLDYFWTVRNMHLPLWVLAKIVEQSPPARIYHTISTGYAGLLGAILHCKHQRPLILSEHGIYTKERRIDLLRQEWIGPKHNHKHHQPLHIRYIRKLWIRFFEDLAQICYESASQVVSLFDDARTQQLIAGAYEKNTTVIANGIDVAPLAELRTRRPEKIPPVLCFLGRVVPIKDIKTFIRSVAIIQQQLPKVEGWIVGPDDADSCYAAECKSLVASMGLTQQIKFLGNQDIRDILPKVGLLVLTSISEGLPLVLLEGFAVGVPAIVTDVGGCHELIYGKAACVQDQALGASGKVVGIADAQSVAKAAMDLLEDSDRWHAAQRAAIARVEQYYNAQQMIGDYQAIYDEVID